MYFLHDHCNVILLFMQCSELTGTYVNPHWLFEIIPHSQQVFTLCRVAPVKLYLR